MDTIVQGARLIGYLLHRLAFALIVGLAVASLVYTLLCAFGQAPWLKLSMSLGGTEIENAGIWVQSGFTGVALLLAFYLPSARRIMALETSHRSFQLGMQDVARAYQFAHSADRNGVFQLSSEFDSVRERLVYLRDHPELGSLEPEVLELAAQMSHISQELAHTYSDEAIKRARDFLAQRQSEVESFNKRLETAKSISTELKHWLHEVELEESVAAAQLERLRDELHEVLPEMEMGRSQIVEAASEIPSEAPRTDEDERVTRLPRAAE